MPPSAPPTAFEPVNMVERQLIAAANGDVEAQKAFERFILDETLYVATPEAPVEEGHAILEADTDIRLLNTSLSDGRTAAAVFTSPQRVFEAFGPVGYLGIAGRQLFEIIRNDPAALNPGQLYGVVWEPASLAAMLGLPTQRTVQKETTFMLGYPADPPVQLIERLRATLPDVPGIQRAWLALAAWPEDASQTWYLDVRTDNSDRELLQRALGSALDGVDMMDRPLDMIVNPAGQSGGTGIVIIGPEADRKSTKKTRWLGRLFS
ncbi:enhanced serine sensitivity protein SseB C-terminal domain-containing protein [Brevundimonas sp.]|uniref:enhanced serine sensitivity protein SseB C-terminal domain-containing protein n=1 Tax=Brevundimonas sp. TaxID=1871086 RepID=UPI002ED97F72